MTWVMLGCYIAVMMVIGIMSARKTTNLTTFVVGGRKAGPWMSALTYGASYFSAVIFIGYAGRSGWDLGLWAVLIGFGNAFFGTYLSWKIIAPRTRAVTRRLKIKTMPQMFETRYGSRNMRIFAGCIIFIFMLPYSASVYSGLSYLCETVLNIEYEIAMLIIAVIAAVYLVLGGYLASLKADFVQGLFIIVGIVAMIIAVLSSQQVGGLVEGVSNLTTKMDQAGILGLSGSSTLSLVSLIFLTSIGTWGLPQMVHKFYAIETEKGIKQGRIISTAFCFLVSAGAYFIGSLGRLFFTEVPMLNGAPNYDLIMPEIFSTTFPEILLGVVLILILSASVSTLSSITLSSCTAVTMDIIPSLAKKEIDKKKIFISTRLLCLAFIAVSYIIALMKSPILLLMSFSWGTVAGSFLAPFLLGLWWKKMTRKGAWCGMLGGFLTSLGLTAATGFNAAYSTITGSVAMIMSLILCIVGSLVFNKKDEKDEICTEQFYDNEYSVE